MTFRIPAGKHRSRPFRIAIWWGNGRFTWRVKFTESCRYDFQGDDQYDTNKLVGIGYLWHHHKDSARFGWRYIPTLTQVELMAYCYVDGVRIIQPLCVCDIGKVYEITLMDYYKNYIFRVFNEDRERIADWSQLHAHKRKLQYGLWPYFGGNRKAPQEITIQLTRL
jgi:hypothetical protein